MKRNKATSNGSISLTKSKKSSFQLDFAYHGIEELKDYLTDDFKFYADRKGAKVANIPCAFDLEASSFYQGENKSSCMYCFVLGFNGHAFFGRTWAEFLDALELISDHYELGEAKRIRFYVHNLSYDSQFFLPRLDLLEVFATEERKPLKIITKDGFEFHCSYRLSGYSLEKTGENLLKYKVAKLKGDLDYSLLRHSETPMTEKEIGYVIHDGLVVMAYIQEQIESHNNNINNIPLTKTGEVRKLIRKKCLYPEGTHQKGSRKRQEYQWQMRNLDLTIPEYELARSRVFQGGFTHGNPFNTMKVCENVTSFDFTSSYPYCLVAFRYPMGKGSTANITSRTQFKDFLKHYCCMFDIQVTEVKAKDVIDFPLSFSKCRNIRDYKLDNGRVIEASILETSMTELDFQVFEAFYHYGKMKIANFWYYRKDYLPTPFVDAILELYEKKTTLKGVDGKEEEYMHSKELLNSIYGCTVTDIARGKVTFEKGEWKSVPPNLEEELEKYNSAFRRFNSYLWGVWCTAYARRNLFTGIFECKSDYIYADTDSIKIMNADKHRKYIEAYNKNVITRLKLAMDHHKFPYARFKPKTIKGEEKILGQWEEEYTVKRFKTLGAKRYLVEYQEPHKLGKVETPYSFTISGVNKIAGIPYLLEECKNTGVDMFDLFSDGLLFPKGHSGKKTHTYIDGEQSGTIVDYLGNEGTYHELGSVHIEDAEYRLSMLADFIKLLLGYQEERE